MKKQAMPRKLHLHRETLHHLTRVRGGFDAKATYTCCDTDTDPCDASIDVCLPTSEC